MILSTDDVNSQVEIFNTNVINCLIECAPLLLKKSPWMNNSIRVAMNIRNTTRLKLKRDQHNVILQEQYKQEKNRVKILIVECISKYYHDEFLNYKGNISKTWKTIKETVPNTKNISNSSNFDSVVNKAN